MTLDDPLSLLMQGILLLAAGMYPLGFLFAVCSPCCEKDPCPWLLEFDRCLRVSVVGSDPPDGGDCRIVSSRAGTGDVEYMTSSFLQIHHVQSEIRITVRLSLSASGTSRTPVGETRTQTWRFNRATPSSPAQSTYDLLGPPWHLQVDLSVTGVATQAEAGVVSSLATDEHGQPKLVLNANQWTANITRDEVVTLFPVGLQRWGPGIGGTQTFRLTTSSATATLTSGTSYSGWSVSKLTGLTIAERKLAARLAGTLCTTGAGGTLTQRIILDDEAAVEFLNGDEELQVTVGAGTRDLRILPNSILCELSSSLVGTGIAIGVYPNEITATADEALSDFLAIRPPVCTSDVSVALRLQSTCDTGWGRVTPPWLAAVPATYPSDRFWPESSPPEFFWPGRSLLWNLENGPFRTSHKPALISWTLSIDGDGDSLSPLLMPQYEPCPAGSQPPPTAHGVANDYCWDVQVPLASLSEPVTVYKWIVPPGSQTICDLTEIDGSFEPVQFFFNDNVLLTAVNALQKPDGGIRYVYSASVAFPSIISQGRFITGGAFVYAEFDYECPLSPPAFVKGYVTGGAGTVRFHPSMVLAPEAWYSPAQLARICNPEPAISPYNPLVAGPPDFYFTISPNFVRRNRKVCGPWTPSELPAGGGTVTRTCEMTDGQTVSSTTTETQSIGASRSGLPIKVAGGDVLQDASCRLLGLRDMRGSTTATVAATLTLGSAPAINSCFSYLPMFGDTTSLGCSGDLSSFTAVPCDSCTVSVTQTAGEENGSVRLITSGDKAGLIEINVKRTWPSGQGVTFTVSCGDDTITQVVRRA